MKLKKISQAIICFFLLSLSAHAGSPVWKVSQGQTHLYVGGTIHILGESDYPLPQAFDRAYDNSHTLVFETDIQKSQDPEFSKTFLKKMVYADPQNLKQLIVADTFQDLRTFTAERGIQVESMLQFKPGLVLLTLTLVEVERMGLAGAGVDEFYFSKAVHGGKGIRHLESLEEQISFLENLGKGNEDQVIAYILKDLETLPRQLTHIKNAWRTGDTPGLEQVILAPLKKDFPQLYLSLIVQRNLHWLPLIEAMIASPGVEFVLVGAAHLAGDQGLLTLLETRGFTLENMQ